LQPFKNPPHSAGHKPDSRAAEEPAMRRRLRQQSQSTSTGVFLCWEENKKTRAKILKRKGA